MSSSSQKLAACLFAPRRLHTFRSLKFGIRDRVGERPGDIVRLRRKIRSLSCRAEHMNHFEQTGHWNSPWFQAVFKTDVNMRAAAKSLSPRATPRIATRSATNSGHRRQYIEHAGRSVVRLAKGRRHAFVGFQPAAESTVVSPSKREPGRSCRHRDRGVVGRQEPLPSVDQVGKIYLSAERLRPIRGRPYGNVPNSRPRRPGRQHMPDRLHRTANFAARAFAAWPSFPYRSAGFETADASVSSMVRN